MICHLAGPLRAFYLKEGVVLAVDAVNKPQEFMMGKRLITGKVKVDPERLADARCPNERTNGLKGRVPMPLVKYIENNGTEHEIHVENGVSVMQGAVDNMIDGIIAECGGACSCATCHCYVDEAWFDKVGAAEEMEQDMIDCAMEPQQTSRLSCQIMVSDELDGLVVRLPESQY